MQCSSCGGSVIWMGRISNLTHTECQVCGAINNQVVDHVDEENDEGCGFGEENCQFHQ